MYSQSYICNYIKYLSGMMLITEQAVEVFMYYVFAIYHINVACTCTPVSVGCFENYKGCFQTGTGMKEIGSEVVVKTHVCTVHHAGQLASAF